MISRNFNKKLIQHKSGIDEVCVIRFKWKDKTSTTISSNTSNNLHWTWTWYRCSYALSQVRHMFIQKEMLSASSCCSSRKRRKQFVNYKNDIFQNHYYTTLKFFCGNSCNFSIFIKCLQPKQFFRWLNKWTGKFL